MTVAPPANAVHHEPSDKLQKVRARDGRNAMPIDRAARRLVFAARAGEREIFHTLGVKMNFALMLAGENFEKFGEGAFGAMTAVNEGRNDGDTQVR